jgi:hypothetical protein
MSDQKKQLAGAVIALGATITDAMDDVPGFVPCGTPAQVILDAISTYSNADDAAAEQVTPNIVAFAGHVSEHRGVAAHELADVDALDDTQRQLAQRVLDLAATNTAATLEPAQVEWLYRSLGALEPGSGKATDLLAQ